MKIIYSCCLTTSLLFSNTIKTSDSKELSLSIYNNNIAMVNDKRNITALNNSKHKLIYEDIPTSIIAQSIMPIFSKNAILYSQNYSDNLISLNKLLKKSINTMIIYKKQIAPFKFKKQKALLLSLDPIMIQLKDEIISDIKNEDIIFNKNNNLLLKPRITWHVKLQKGNQDLNINYLTNNISWKSDYILNLDNTNTLNAWVSIKNDSGLSYKNANIYCIAGDVRKNNNNIMQTRSYVRKAELQMSDFSNVKAKSFLAYSLYKMPFKINLNDKESKQINFINKKNIKVTSKASSENSIYFHNFSSIKSKKLTHKIYLNNTKTDGLGISMPKGTIRVYKNDGNISHFIGENIIKNSSIGKKISFDIGKFFDISEDIEQLEFKKTKQFIQSKYKRTITNNTNKTQIIQIKESYYSNNNKKITNSNNCKNNCEVISNGNSSYTYTIKLNASSKYELISDYKMTYLLHLK